MWHPIASNFSEVKLRYLFLAPAALFVQIVASHLIPLMFGVDVRPAWLGASYLLLLAFLAINHRNPAVLIVGAGTIMNFAAILANGGFMPTTPQAVMGVGLQDRIAGLELGDVVPQTTIVLLDKSQIRLWFLTDVLSINSPFKRVFSIGDILVVVGVVLLLVQLALNVISRRASAQGRKRRVGQGDLSPIIQPDVD